MLLGVLDEYPTVGPPRELSHESVDRIMGESRVPRGQSEEGPRNAFPERNQLNGQGGFAIDHVDDVLSLTELDFAHQDINPRQKK